MVSDVHPFVLIAEDAEDDVELLRRSFIQAGMAALAYVVRDGEECIAYLSGTGKYENREEHPLPDLLLLDLKMPKLNGFEVLKWIRAQPSLASLPVIVLTSSERTRDVDLAYELGASSFLTKPMNFIDFSTMIQVMLTYWREWSKTPTIERPARQPSH